MDKDIISVRETLACGFVGYCLLIMCHVPIIDAILVVLSCVFMFKWRGRLRLALLSFSVPIFAAMVGEYNSLYLYFMFAGFFTSNISVSVDEKDYRALKRLFILDVVICIFSVLILNGLVPPYDVMISSTSIDPLIFLSGFFWINTVAIGWKFITAKMDKNEQKEKFEEGILAVAGISAVLLRYNGGYTEKAQDLFRKYFKENYSDKELYKEEHFKKAEKRLVSLMNMHNLNFKKYCLEVNRNISYEGKVELMRLLFDIAVLDGGIYPEERNLLHQIMVHIRISEEDAQLLTDMYSRYFYESRASYERAQGSYTSSGSYVPSRLVEAYAKLGLKPGTCLDEVKRVYRRLVFENHPDRLVGADEDTRAAANERIREVNRAMSVITEYAS